MADLQFQYQDTQAGDRAQAAAEEQATAPKPPIPDFGSLVSAQWRQNAMTPTLVQKLFGPGEDTPNPDFYTTPEMLQETQKKNNFPDEWMQSYIGAKSQNMYDHITDQLVQKRTDDQTLAAGRGFSTIAGATTMADPVEAMIYGVGGGVGWAAKGTRLARVFKAGLANGTAAYSVEKYLTEQQDQRDPHDAAMAGFTGFLLGAPLGLLSPAENELLRAGARDAYTSTQLQKIKGDGMPLTPAGEMRLVRAQGPYTGEKFTPPTPSLSAEEARAQALKNLTPTFEQELQPLRGELDINEAKTMQDQGLSGFTGQLRDLAEANQAEADHVALQNGQVPARFEDRVAAEAANLQKGMQRKPLAGALGEAYPDTGPLTFEHPENLSPEAMARREELGQAASDVADSGFLGGSVGAAQVGEVPDVRSAKLWLGNPFTGKPMTVFGKKIPIRWDYRAMFERSDNPMARKIGRLFAAESVGMEGHYAVEPTVSELAQLRMMKDGGQYVLEQRKAWDAYSKRMGYGWKQRSLAGPEAADFFKSVTDIVNGDRQLAESMPEAAGFAKVQQKLQDGLYEDNVKLGVPHDEQGIKDYMMRRANYDGINRMRAEHGPDRVLDLVKKAVIARGGVTDEGAERVAKQWFTRTTRRQFDPKAQSAFMTSTDREALVKSVMEDATLQDPEKEALLDLLGTLPEKQPTVESSRMKARISLDPNYSITYKDANGVDKVMSMKDMFERDSRTLWAQYSRQMSGLYGRAKLGIKSDADFEKLISDMHDWHAANGNPADAEAMKALDTHAHDLNDFVLGKPMGGGNPNSRWERTYRVMRDMNFIRQSGSFGMAQLPDMGQLVGFTGWRAMGQQMPELENIIKLAKAGQMDDQLQRDLVNIFGGGTEMHQHNPIWKDISEFTPDSGLTKLESMTRTGANAMSYANGMMGVRTFEKTIAGRAIAQRLMDYANGTQKMGADMVKRLAAEGLGEDTLEQVLDRFRTHGTVEGPSKKLTHLDVESWAKQSPKSYDAFQLAMFRTTRRFIHDYTIGETGPWMHTILGRLLTQFRHFNLVAWSKQTLYGVHHFGPSTLHGWMMSALMGGLSYTGLTAMNYANNPEELAKRLSPDHIGIGALSRANWSSIVPMTSGTLSSMMFNSNPWEFGRASGLDQNVVTGNPYYDLVYNKAYGTMRSAAQSAFTNDYVWTQHDARNSMQMLPNLYGMQNLIHSVTGNLPKSNYLRQGLKQ